MLTGIEAFQQRFEGYEGEVFFVGSVQDAMQKALEIIKELQTTRVGVSQDLPDLIFMLDQAGIQYTFDLPKADVLPRVGITSAAGIVAETGSLVLDDNNPGVRNWSMVCDIHIAILIEPMIFNTLDDLFSGNSDLLQSGICLASGPSRTADIEKQLILGMHGPKRLIAIIVGDL